MTISTGLKKILFGFFIAASLMTAPAVFAQSNNPIDKIDIIVPEPRINIPGLDFTEAEKIKANARERYERDQKLILQIPYLAEYVAKVYKYMVGIASILAVIMIIVAGFQWSISGGNPTTIQSAQKRIANAVIGLVLAVTSYAVLYAINPALVTFRSLSLQYVEGIPVLPDGEPESASEGGGSAGYNIGPLDAGCPNKLSALASYASTPKLFGAKDGYCLKWAKRAIEDACGKIPQSLAKGSAWDAAASFKASGKFHACNLNGIQNGDIVFMTTVGSKWIGLWENFRLGPDGCTIADAVAPGKVVIKLKNGGKRTDVSSVTPKPTGGMPPVTHVGIYYDEKVYHLTDVVEDTPANSSKITPNPRRTKDEAPGWGGVVLGGDFIAGQRIFIAGYVKQSDL